MSGEHLLQDVSRELTEWFASRPGSRRQAREAAEEIGRMKQTIILKTLEHASGERDAPDEKWAVTYRIVGELHDRRLTITREQLANFVRTCNICGEQRPADKIDVRRRDVSAEKGLRPGSVIEQCPHCNDKPACIEGAKTWRVPEGARVQP